MPKKILLAEDSLTIQKVFELTFAQSDFALTMVDNGVDAVRLAAEIAPDLVVADVTLPGRNGFEVAGDLSASPSTRGCPVLILSGSLGPFDEESFKSSGAAGVLFKPFESQELIDKVNEMLSAAEAAAGAVLGETAAPGSEEWDFSDVLEEVEAGHGKAPAPARSDEFLAGAAATGSVASLGEFDISLDEIEGSGLPEPPPAEPAAPSAWPDSPAEPQFSAGQPCEDDPAGVTDLSPALAAVEDLEEIEDLEEMEVIHKESEGPLAIEELQPAGAAPEELLESVLVGDESGFDVCAIDEGEPEAERAGIVEPPPAEEASVPDLEPAYAPRAEPEEDLEAIAEPPPEPAAPSAPSVELLAADALREQFSARAREIVEKVATEAVEKVMWEWMGRLSEEFTERIRESVESVAWEVIPKTAEALIREEIARIRQQEGKQGESR